MMSQLTQTRAISGRVGQVCMGQVNDEAEAGSGQVGVGQVVVGQVNDEAGQVRLGQVNDEATLT